MTRRVLVADADRLDRTVVATLLALEGYEVVLADDGEAAIAAATATPQVDVALLARGMPGPATGIEVLARLRSDGATADVPVVLLTDVAAPARGADLPTVDLPTLDPLTVGAQAMVTTPCSPMHLIEVLDQLLDEE